VDRLIGGGRSGSRLGFGLFAGDPLLLEALAFRVKQCKFRLRRSQFQAFRIRFKSRAEALQGLVQAITSQQAARFINRLFRRRPAGTLRRFCLFSGQPFPLQAFLLSPLLFQPLPLSPLPLDFHLCRCEGQAQIVVRRIFFERKPKNLY
jgi:hypothetical protein